MQNDKQTFGGGMAMAAGAIMGLMGLGACVAGSAPRGVVVTSGQLAATISDGARVELTLAADGSVREVEIENEGLGHADQIQGRVVSFDASLGAIEVEHLGGIDIGSAVRFRDDAESRQDKGVWMTELSAVLTGGAAAYVRADGSFAVERFAAADVRLERGARRTQIEGDVGPGDFDAASGTLTLGGRKFPIAGASIHTEDGVHESGDDNGNDGVEVGDDNGNDGVEAGDDNGNDGVEVGDDNGNDGVEVGDDNGNDGVEVGDDNGNDGVEVGDDNGNDGVEVGDDNGDDGVEVGDDNGNDGVEVGDDNGGSRVEPGDDNGGSRVEPGDDNGGSNDGSDDDEDDDDGDEDESDDDHGGHGGDSDSDD